MSLTVGAFLIDLDQLRAIYGSHDTALLAAVERAFAEELEEDETPREVMVHYKGADEPRWEIEAPREPTLRQALRAIIDGEVPSSGDGSQYGYALELLCRYLGEDLPNQPFDGFGQFPGDFAYGDELDTWRPPLPIPRPDDALAITSFTNGEAAAKLGQVPPIELVAPLYWDDYKTWDAETWESWEKEWGKRLHKQYRLWLEEAVRTGNDIVTFMH